MTGSFPEFGNGLGTERTPAGGLGPGRRVAGFRPDFGLQPLAYRAGEMAERNDLRGFDAIHLANAARLGERFSDVRFLAFDARLMEAARGTPVQAYGGERASSDGPWGRPRRGEPVGRRARYASTPSVGGKGRAIIYNQGQPSAEMRSGICQRTTPSTQGASSRQAPTK